MARVMTKEQKEIKDLRKLAHSAEAVLRRLTEIGRIDGYRYHEGRILVFVGNTTIKGVS